MITEIKFEDLPKKYNKGSYRINGKFYLIVSFDTLRPVDKSLPDIKIIYPKNQAESK